MFHDSGAVRFGRSNMLRAERLCEGRNSKFEARPMRPSTRQSLKRRLLGRLSSQQEQHGRGSSMPECRGQGAKKLIFIAQREQCRQPGALK
jgi:hypothetical protein